MCGKADSAPGLLCLGFYLLEALLLWEKMVEQQDEKIWNETGICSLEAEG